ncbi:MAG: hypothetical protein ACFB51_06025 [Anaerolineae bacterium]
MGMRTGADILLKTGVGMIGTALLGLATFAGQAETFLVLWGVAGITFVIGGSTLLVVLDE